MKIVESLKITINGIINNKKYLLFLTVIPLIIDIITKNLIKSKLMLYDAVPVIDGFFNIVYVLNPGAAFSFLHDMNESYRRLFFITVTIIAIFVVLYIFAREKSKINTAGFALILSGAIGNLIDRIIIGKVVDFLDFYYKTYHFPAFNVADSCITVGVALIIIDILFFSKKRDNDKKSV